MIVTLSSSGKYLLYINNGLYNVFDLDMHCVVCQSEDPVKVLDKWRDIYYSGSLPRENSVISHNFD